MKSFVCAVLLVIVVAAEPPSYRQVKYRSATAESAHADTADAENTPYPAAGFKPTKEFNLPITQQLSPPAASYGTPEDSYRAPFNSYLAPQVEYGPPNAITSQRRKDVKKEEHSDSESIESSESSESAESASNESQSSKNKGSAENKDKSQKLEKKEMSEKPQKTEKSVKSENSKKSENTKKSEKSENTQKKDEKQKENLEDASKSDEIISTQGAYFVLLPSSQLQRVQYMTQNDLTKMAYTASLQYKNEQAPVFVYNPTPQYQQIQQPVVAAYSYAW